MNILYIMAGIAAAILFIILHFVHAMYAKVMWVAGAISMVGYGARYLFKLFRSKI